MSAPLVALSGARPFVRPPIELADIVRFLSEEYLASRNLSAAQARVLRDIERCRTPALGGHLDVCEQCGHTQPSYNSCRNRHCPKCQGIRRAQWVADRMEQILPTAYFHTVVTIAHELNPLFQANPARLCGLFFHAVACALPNAVTSPCIIASGSGRGKWRERVCQALHPAPGPAKRLESHRGRHRRDAIPSLPSKAPGRDGGARDRLKPVVC